MKRKNALILAGVWLLVMVGIIASTLTLLASGSNGGRRWVSSEEYAMIERYARLEEVRLQLTDGYYLPVEEDELITGALRGMTQSLGDAYTFYYTPEEMAAYNEKTQGEYVGVGMIVQSNDAGDIEIVRVYEDGPAYQAGIRAGDCIVAVDGSAVDGSSDQRLNDAVACIRGAEGTETVLRILRNGETMDFSVLRGEVSISNVDSCMLENGIGYIEIYQFSGDADLAFEKALESLEDEGAQGLVIDLRNNPGGLLDQVVKIADLLLPSGTIVYTQDRNGSREDYYSDEKMCSLPLVVLVNEMSASASEILAAAVQDFERGLVVGAQTYGKGIVQSVVNFESDGAGLQYTSSCYYTPSGRSIHGCGVTPDLPVEGDADFHNPEEPDLNGDAQLLAALDTLSELVDSGA